MTPQDKAAWLISHPYELGKALGYKDFRPFHGMWIKEMVTGKQDMTLQAHRGSFKTTCLCVAIAIMMVRYRDQNIMFLRKTDMDVAEALPFKRQCWEADLYVYHQIIMALAQR